MKQPSFAPLSPVHYQDIRHRLERIAHRLLGAPSYTDADAMTLGAVVQFLQSHCHACGGALRSDEQRYTNGWLCGRCRRRQPWLRN